MIGRRSGALTALLFALALVIVAGLLVAEFRESRYDGCMRVGAFSKSECEDFARE